MGELLFAESRSRPRHRPCEYSTRTPSRCERGSGAMSWPRRRARSAAGNTMLPPCVTTKAVVPSCRRPAIDSHIARLVPGAGRKSGVMKGHITVYEPGDYAHPSLPTLREFITKNMDASTGILTFDAPGNVRLSMDPAPLREFPAEYLEYRVSPGCTFVTHDALTRAKP